MTDATLLLAALYTSKSLGYCSGLPFEAPKAPTHIVIFLFRITRYGGHLAQRATSPAAQVQC